jgi:hypothetical protein
LYKWQKLNAKTAPCPIAQSLKLVVPIRIGTFSGADRTTIAEIYR